MCGKDFLLKIQVGHPSSKLQLLAFKNYGYNTNNFNVDAKK